MSHFVSRFALAASLLLPAVPALAEEQAPSKPALKTAWEASREHDDNATVTTGVAKARDPLNSATSTSVLREPSIRRLGPTSVAELLRTIPGIRVETDMAEVGNSYSIRGLPLVGEGSKYIQFQEDGLPVLEFGDMSSVSIDNLVRGDLNLASIESIRGGSASTFASDSPGGVINFLSKTGEVEGGSVMVSSGLERGTKRFDADYGGHIGNDWRFHMGGFYRSGEGPRSLGYDAYRGGQFKFNITRQLTDGYVRFSLKVLDDRTPTSVTTVPLAVSGTESDPHYSDVPGFSAKDDSLNSRYINRLQQLTARGDLETLSLHDGTRVKSVALGMETQFQIGDWTVSDRFRYSRNSVRAMGSLAILALPSSVLVPTFGGPGATATYYSGPNAGQPVGPMVNGNGILTVNAAFDSNLHDIDFVVNDLRASRVFSAGGGDLTLTSGLYAARQSIGMDLAVSTFVQDAAGNGNSGLVSISNNGFPITQNGTLMFRSIGPAGTVADRDASHTILAPYGSFNFHKGAISFGGSVRFDTDAVRGTSRVDGPGDVKFIDLDGNGVPSSFAETTFAFIPADKPGQVHYNTHKLSWSTGINWRIAEYLSASARYSSGNRKGADRILIPSVVDPVTGALIDPVAVQDTVRQAEVGVKFRKPGVTVNLTGFFAKTRESNNQVIASGTNVTYMLVNRGYRAYGAEFEAAVRQGPFSLNAGATLTHAEITANSGSAGLIGNLARHQPTLIWQLTPAYDDDMFTLGASIVGTTSSYTQDVNQLRMPGYTTVGLFGRFRPVDRVELGVNVSNLFNTLALVSVIDGTMPATGVVLGQTLAGRRATASIRFFY